MLLLSGPSVAAVPLRECGEQLIDLRAHGGLLIDMRKQDDVGAWARLRAGVLHRLLTAQESLPTGVQLLVIEGHRPETLQRHYFGNYLADLRQAHPDWPERRLTEEASKHVSRLRWLRIQPAPR